MLSSSSLSLSIRLHHSSIMFFCLFHQIVVTQTKGFITKQHVYDEVFLMSKDSFRQWHFSVLQPLYQDTSECIIALILFKSSSHFEVSLQHTVNFSNHSCKFQTWKCSDSCSSLLCMSRPPCYFPTAITGLTCDSLHPEKTRKMTL